MKRDKELIQAIVLGGALTLFSLILFVVIFLEKAKIL
jgi:hypothetical protein